MAKRMTYAEANEQLDLTYVWDMATNPNGTPVPTRAGVMKSPLRVDQKGASFSVTRDLRFFKDHAEPDHKGGVYKFIELCRPEWSKGEIVREMIVRAGGDPDAKDPNWKRPSIAEWRAEKQKATEDAGKRWEREQRKLSQLPKLARWPEAVRKRFEKCNDRADGTWMQKLAGERGWPGSWVEHLVDLGKIGATPKGGVSFLVEAYCHRSGNFGAVGVHERWLTADGKKMWSYRPCMKWDKMEIAAYPFIMGNAHAPIWVICEGQWDAVTVHGLLNGFEETPSLDVFTIGIRGASGVGAFMANYEGLIRKVKPQMILMPDADEAAVAWTEDQRKQPGELPTWSFARKLREVFELRVKWLKCSGKHKDINDWYRDGVLTADDVAGALCGVVKL